LRKDSLGIGYQYDAAEMQTWQANKKTDSNAKNESGINQTILGISMKKDPFPWTIKSFVS
jgi:hypothetical protein